MTSAGQPAQTGRTGRGAWRWAWRTGLVGLALAAVLALALAVAWISWPRLIEAAGPFEARPLDLNAWDWYDLGVVDLNDDGFLDLFTSNHDAEQSLLLGDGRGGFTDVLATWGLSQVPAFPAVEDSQAAPVQDAEGLYIYFRNRALVLRRHGGSELPVARGSLRFSAPAETRSERGFEVEVTQTQAPSGAILSDLSFASDGAGELVVQLPFNAIPITVDLARDVALEQVFVGHQRRQPDTHEFELYLRDRHGLAWADLNDDGILDVFISRGGLLGQMRDLPEDYQDELLLSAGQGRYDERAAEMGLAKNGCPGRQASWLDFNGDGRLDLYVVCGRRGGGFWDYVPRALQAVGGDDGSPNQLYEQLPDGRFRDVAPELGLDFGEAGTSVWLDVDADGDLDLLWASTTGIWLYRNQDGRFTAEPQTPHPTTLVRKLTLADIDADGDLDVFAAAAIGSRLLVNQDGTFDSVTPGEFGLPSSGRTASWVDFDNDGRVDLHVWPGGLYRQQPDGSFEAQGLLDFSSPYWWFVDPRLIWFDYDNDGSRDLVVAQRYFPFVVQNAAPELLPFTARLFRNLGQQPPNHWLQVQLIGPAGNRQAIGATVTVATPDGEQLAQVGAAEGSHYSQGHYRLYFGLGAHASPSSVAVRWPDGSVDRLAEPPGDRLLVLRQGSVDAAMTGRGR